VNNETLNYRPMKKILFLLSIFTIILIILITFITSNAKATTYYVKNRGNDLAEGTSDATAWGTINKVNSFNFSAGDSVLFKRGDMWREQLAAKSGDTFGYITFGAYGVGAKPLFLGSVNLMKGWVNLGTNIWQNSDASLTRQVGNLIFNNETSYGVKVSSEAELNSQGKFWYDWDNNRIKLYSTSNPVTYYIRIEAALAGMTIVGFDGKSFICFDNLDFRYSGNGTIFGEDTHHIIVRSCDFSYNGGCNISEENNARLGGGIGTWNEASYWLVEKCRFDNEYDCATTNQGYDVSTVHDIIWRNNIISNCEYSFEWFEDAESTVYNIWFENNTCIYAGGGWSHYQRPDGVNGRHLMIWNMPANTTDFYIRNNIFYEATEGIVRNNNITVLQNVVSDYNDLYQSTGNIGYVENGIGSGDYYTLTSWRSATGKEINSINFNPLLNIDFTLVPSSLCIDAGVSTTQVTTDYWGTTRPQNRFYDIGAYEYLFLIPEISCTLPFYK